MVAKKDQLQQLLDAVVENDREMLIFCIKQYYPGTFSENELWSIALEPKVQLRERIKQIILIEINAIKSGTIS